MLLSDFRMSGINLAKVKKPSQGKDGVPLRRFLDLRKVEKNAPCVKVS